MFFLCGTEQFYSVCWPSRLILVSSSMEDRAEGLAGHIIFLLGLHACFRKLFLSISLPLHVNNSPYLLPLKFSRVGGGARRICSGCWTKLLPKHAAITKRSTWVSVNCVVGKSLHIPTCCTALPTNVLAVLALWEQEPKSHLGTKTWKHILTLAGVYVAVSTAFLLCY